MDKLFDASSMVKEQLEYFEQAKAMHQEEIIEVAMYHKDSSVKLECIVSYIKKNYE